MKKLFLFATIAAAGLFASCSSTDDAISDAANNPIEDIDGDKEAIKISMGNLGNIVTRGTGTVGGVENGDFTDNVWAGQYIKVFMFDKDKTPVANSNPVTYTYAHTLKPTKVDGSYLYNNSLMVTPGSDENLILNASADVSSGEAMLKDGTINYYPTTGNFDFFGYHGDDAVANNAEIKRWKSNGDAIDANTTSYEDDAKWTVEFNINGSQDLMSTKAQLTASQAASYTSQDYYSAKAARKGVQPTLTFNHLLTRFAFKVKADESFPAAAGWMKGVQVKNKDNSTDFSSWTVLTYTKKETLPTLTTDQYNALSAEYKTWFTKNATSGNYEMTGGFTTINKDTYDSWIANLPTYDNSPLKNFYEEKTYIKEDAAASAHAENAVKVKSIQIFSKTKGEMAVAWKDGDDHAVTSYEMGIISPATYLGLDPSNQANWQAVGDPAQYYKWVGAAVTSTIYDGLSDAEKAVATAVHGNTLADADKIVFDETEPNKGKWLTLKARPYAKKKTLDAALEDADFTNGVAYKADLEAAETPYNTTKSAFEALQEADPGYEAAKTAYETAKAVYDAAKKKYDDLKALDANLISEAVWGKLSGTGQAKFKVLAGKEKLNEQLIAITPTAPTWNNEAAVGKKSVPAEIGEALIVAPKYAEENPTTATADYKMRVTVVQKQLVNWKTGEEKEVEVPYELTIKSPAGGFKNNYSYNIILTVYSLERIEVTAEITPWIQNTPDINYDPDND